MDDHERLPVDRSIVLEARGHAAATPVRASAGTSSHRPGAAALFVCLVVLSCTAEKLGTGARCERNSECAAPLVCRLDRCRRECNTTRDCPAGLTCVLDGQGIGACQLPAEKSCSRESDCPDPLVCRFSQCVNACNEDRDCPAGSFCVMDTDGSRACIDPSGKACVYHEECAPQGQTCALDGRCRSECINDRDCQLGSTCCADSLCHEDCGSVTPPDMGPPPGRECAPGVTRSCFGGTDAQRNEGTCAAGIQVCGATGTFGPCSGGLDPSVEVCDGADNDCDGATDDGLVACAPEIVCPPAARARPFETHALRGSDLYAGSATWRWQLECPPTLPASSCPRIADPTSADTEVYLSAAGVFRLSVEVTPAGGDPVSCTWPLTVAGEGLRVELTWDQEGGVDLDLHLHRWTTNETGGETAWETGDDCYWQNCKVGGRIDWADAPHPGDHAPTTDLAACQDAPHGEGARWVAAGSCRNPRLDVDLIPPCSLAVTDPDAFNACVPENVSVDVPVAGMPYRIMAVHFVRLDERPATPTVTVHCGGALAAVLGAGAVVLGAPERKLWLVADVVFDSGGTCRVIPLERFEPFQEDLRFGPGWSCRYDPSTGRCETTAAPTGP